jgi:hypothetical protein
MARKIKSFIIETPANETAVEVEPITFELIKGETFEAFGEVAGAVTLEFIAATSGDDSAKTAQGILDYLEASMDEANFKRFNAIIRSPKHKIKIETLSEIVSYLIEERTSRPTEAS